MVDVNSVPLPFEHLKDKVEKCVKSTETRFENVMIAMTNQNYEIAMPIVKNLSNL